jgi:hypothetical protein
VAADASRDGSLGFASRRVVRLAAERAAFFRRAVFPVAARRAAAAGRFAARLAADRLLDAAPAERFAGRLPATRFAALRRVAPLRAAAPGFLVRDCFVDVRFAKSPPLTTE